MSVKVPVRYEILSEIGEGSGGVVYSVRDAADGSERALKLLQTARIPGCGAEADRESAVLAREFELLRGLEHPGLVAVHDFGTCDAGAFFTMDLCEGVEPLQSGLVPPDPRFYEALASILRALQFLHSRRLVHGDLKPGNVRIVDLDGARPHAVLLDFGLSREISDRRRSGTVEYMAPEVASGVASDHRADLYSLGVLVYEWVAGAPPFRGDAYEVLRAHAFEKPTALLVRAPGTPPALSSLVEAFLAKDPRARPESANAAIERLNRDLGLALAVQPGRVAAGRASRLPLAGRSREVDSLRGFLERLRDGGAPPVLRFSGPAGMGKTRLLAEAKALAQVSGFHVASAGAEDPLAGWERSAGIEPQAHDSGAVSVARLLRLHPRPALFILDDAQLLGAAAEDVVSLARYLAADREMDGEWAHSALVTATRPAAELVGLFETTHIEVETIELRPLDAESVRAFLLDALGAASIPSRILTTVSEQTGGVPSLLVMAAERVAESLPEGGGGEAALIERVEAGLDLPVDAAEALAARARRLGEPALTLLGACGLLPSGVPAEALAALARGKGVDGWGVLGGLERDGWLSVERGMVRAPALAARPALDALGAEGVRELADSLAGILEMTGAPEATVLALRLSGGDQEAILAAARRIAEGTAGLSATERRRLLARALERPELEATPESRVCAEALALAEIDVGETGRAVERLRSLLGARDLCARDRVRLKAHLARALRFAGGLEEANALCGEVLADPEADARTRAEVESDLVIIERRSGRLAESVARTERLLATVDESMAGVRARLLTSMGLALAKQGRRHEAHQHFLESAARYRAEGNRTDGLNAEYNGGVLLADMGRMRSARSVFENVRGECHAADLANGAMLSTESLGGCAAVAGGFPEALSFLTETTRLAARLGDQPTRFRALIGAAWVRCYLADFDGALRDLLSAEDYRASGDDIRDLLMLSLHKGETLAHLGDEPGARQALLEAVRVSERDESPSSHEARAWYAWLTGSTDCAAEIREELSILHRGEYASAVAGCRTLLGAALLREDRYEEVVTALEMTPEVEDDDVERSLGAFRTHGLLLRGRAFEAMGNLDGAIRDYEAARLLAETRSQADELWKAEAQSGLLRFQANDMRGAVPRLANATALIRTITGKLRPASRNLFLSQEDRALLLARVAQALNEAA